MNISPNLIRFPSPAPVAERHAESRVKPDNVIEFTDAQPEASRLSADAQAHGQMFAAHRIVARVADQLDAIAAL